MRRRQGQLGFQQQIWEVMLMRRSHLMKQEWWLQRKPLLEAPLRVQLRQSSRSPAIQQLPMLWLLPCPLHHTPCSRRQAPLMQLAAPHLLQLVNLPCQPLGAWLLGVEREPHLVPHPHCPLTHRALLLLPLEPASLQSQGRWELQQPCARSTPLPLSTTWVAATGQVVGVHHARQLAQGHLQLGPQVSMAQLLPKQQQHQPWHLQALSLLWTLQPQLLCMAVVARRPAA
jgi:hypothetical protein